MFVRVRYRSFFRCFAELYCCDYPFSELHAAYDSEQRYNVFVGDFVVAVNIVLRIVRCVAGNVSEQGNNVFVVNKAVVVDVVRDTGFFTGGIIRFSGIVRFGGVVGFGVGFGGIVRFGVGFGGFFAACSLSDRECESYGVINSTLGLEYFNDRAVFRYGNYLDGVLSCRESVNRYPDRIALCSGKSGAFKLCGSVLDEGRIGYYFTVVYNVAESC